MGIVLDPYDPEWPRLFEAERVLVERVLAPWLEGGIHHIGCTAIPGLAARPIIDMMAGVRDLEAARAAYEPLAEIGYLHEPHRPGIAHHLSKTSLRRRGHRPVRPSARTEVSQREAELGGETVRDQ